LATKLRGVQYRHGKLPTLIYYDRMADCA